MIQPFLTTWEGDEPIGFLCVRSPGCPGVTLELHVGRLLVGLALKWEGGLLMSCGAVLFWLLLILGITLWRGPVPGVCVLVIFFCIAELRSQALKNR